MKASSPTSLVLWVLVLALAVASLAFGYVQLDGLPDMGVQLGPDLAVRAVSVDKEVTAEHQELKRGDRIVALQSQSVEDLRDLRTVLSSLRAGPSADEQPDAMPDSSEQGADDVDGITITYQLVRPLHRFPVVLQGEVDDPTALPPGVEPSDRLVELDGRPLPSKVGPEAVRSIVSSRPQASLVFERKNAIFSGTMIVSPPEPPVGVLGVFGMAILVLAGIWLFRAREVEPAAVVAVGLETVCFAWVALLAFQYQWTLSQYGLTAAVAAAFALLRPLAFFSRNVGEGAGTQSGWIALFVGALAAAGVLGLLFGDYFGNAEQALHVAALIAGLFVIYEIFLASVEDAGPRSSLGDGGGYLAWILVLAMFFALVAWYLEPISFAESRWRWFAAVVLGLIWLGDLLHCLHGPGRSGYASIASKEERRELVIDYLERAAELLPEVRLRLVVATPETGAVLEPRAGLLSTSRVSEPLHDAVSILVQERVRIPLPDVINRQAHPMGGIAKAMDMVLALRLGRPDGGVEISGVDLVLVGTERAPAGDLPSHPSNETLDELQFQLDADVWTAALVEGYVAMRDGEEPAAPSTLDDEARERIAQLEATIAELRAKQPDGSADADGPVEHEPSADTPAPVEPAARPQESASSEEKRSPAPEDAPAPAEVAVEPLPPAPASMERLLEPELLDALDYLLESQEALVLGGAPGAGKSFIARCAHSLDERPGELLSFRADAHSEDAHLGLLFGEGPDPPSAPAVIERCEGGALLIESSEHLSDAVLLRLCQAAESGTVRLYLAFDDPDAEQKSVLASRTQELQELLEHRELIVPALRRRSQIFEAVLEHLAVEAGASAPVLSAEALELLRDSSFPGHIDQLRAVLERALVNADSDVIEVDDVRDEVTAEPSEPAIP